MNWSHTPRIGELLVARRRLSSERLKRALAAQRPGSERIGQTLIRLGMITRWQLWRTLAEQYCLCFVTAIGTMTMAVHPAYARSASATMQVSVTVTNQASLSLAPPPDRQAAPGGALAVTCRQAVPVEVTLARATVSSGSDPRLSLQPVLRERADCQTNGAAAAVPAVARKLAGSAGLMSIEIAY